MMDEMRSGQATSYRDIQARPGIPQPLVRVAPGGGFRPGGIVAPTLPAQIGYDSHTRYDITQIYIGCQSVMIYPAAGHVELLLSMDPSGVWQAITPDAAEELGQRLLHAAHAARSLLTQKEPE